MQEQPNFLNVKEVSAYWGIKTSTIYAKVEAGELPHYKVGRLIRFRQDHLDSWMEKHRKESVDANKKAKSILKRANSNLDIDRIVKKTVEEVRGKGYTSDHGKPDRKIKGLRKEVEDGTL